MLLRNLWRSWPTVWSVLETTYSSNTKPTSHYMWRYRQISKHYKGYKVTQFYILQYQKIGNWLIFFTQSIEYTASKCNLIDYKSVPLIYLSFFFLFSNEKEQKLVCNICHIFEKTQVTATHFCKTCQDPEPWCEHCAKQHTRQKLSQDHILSTDIGKLPKVKTNSSHK